MRKIYEYEFWIEHKGKLKTVQQSAFDSNDAKRRIKDKLPDCKIGKLKKKFQYPHMEGGKKIG